MQARRIARELALLSISQLPPKPDRLTTQQLQSFVVAAVRTLTTEVQDTLETAAAELQRSSDRLLSSETRTTDVNSARAMLRDAMELTRTALNRMGTAIDLPETIQLANQQEVRNYAIELLSMVQVHQVELDELLNECMVDWQMKRLARIDRRLKSGFRRKWKRERRSGSDARRRNARRRSRPSKRRSNKFFARRRRILRLFQRFPASPFLP